MTYQETWSPKVDQHEAARERYIEEATRFLSSVRRPITGRVLEAKHPN